MMPRGMHMSLTRSLLKRAIDTAMLHVESRGKEEE